MISKILIITFSLMLVACSNKRITAVLNAENLDSADPEVFAGRDLASVNSPARKIKKLYFIGQSTGGQEQELKILLGIKKDSLYEFVLYSDEDTSYFIRHQLKYSYNGQKQFFHGNMYFSNLDTSNTFVIANRYEPYRVDTCRTEKFFPYMANLISSDTISLD